jgi:Glycosyl transferase family group 2
MNSNSSISQDRKSRIYRNLEASIGLSAIVFLIVMLLLSFVSRSIVSVFLILYSFMWVLKFSLNAIYTIYTYNQARRWEEINWPRMLDLLGDKSDQAIQVLDEFKSKYRSKLDHVHKLEQDQVAIRAIQNTKFADPRKINHVSIFSIYNEPSEVLIRSLQHIYEAGYDRTKLVVFVSQEARAGAAHNQSVRDAVSQVDQFETHFFAEQNLDLVYSKAHRSMDYDNLELAKIQPKPEKLLVIFTQHPDGLVGEIKGKASNEDWGARHASLFVKAKKIDPEMATVTSLDADSHLSPDFFHNLSYRYCLTSERSESGFQPIHVYSNNFFQTGFWPRLVATQTTIWNLTQLGLDGEASLFAIYSLPLTVIQDVDFWVREVIAEDSLMFIKCMVHYQGRFKVVPFYGVFEGDAVEAEDYFEAIANQYLQLQRWAWGGIEDFPYMFKNFILTPESHKIDFRLRCRFLFLKFTNHFFWSTTPVLFSIGALLPPFLGGERFRETPISQNLSILSQYFAWISLIFLIIFGFITFRFIAYRALKKEKLSFHHTFLILIQFAVSPFIYGFMGIAALDAQIRGIQGRYLGYWVTPKK